jgi:diguanylate cyclase (GGDEF)-like protein/PAS domain S-box-containing protein
MRLGNYIDALLGFILLLAIVWTLRRARPAAHPRALPDITPETASEWVPLVPQATGYAVSICDTKRHIVWVNDAFIRLTGYTLAEAKGRRVGDLLFFPRTDPETIRRLRGAFASGHGMRFEIQVCGKDGREWWLDTDARPLRDDQGAIKGWVCLHSDVTAEVRKREASRRNESRAQMIIEGGRIGTWEWDATTDMVETNSVFLTTLGLPGEDRIHGLEWLRDLCHPDDRPACDLAIREVIEGRSPMFRGHHRLRGKDGQWRWILGAGGVLERDAEGKPLRLYGVQFDITEHKLAEEQRRLASERLAVIAEYVPGMIFQWRYVPDGNRGEFLYVSPGANSVYGLPPAALLNDGAMLRKIAHEEDREAVAESMHRSRESLQPWHIEHRVVRPDGEVGWVEGDALPRRLEDGSTVWNGYVADVTLSKHAQEELRISESKLRSLYDLSPLGIALNDMAGRFLQTNRAVEMITGYSQEELLALKWAHWEITDPDSERPLRIESLLHEGRFGPVEMSLKRKDGSRVPVQITGIIVHSTDGTRHIWSMVEDISVRKRSEQRISFLAYHDALTGLENRLGLRSKLEEMLDNSLESGESLAVVLIDLDRFKYVNDSLGHDVGDELLVEIARRLKSMLRDDDIVARLGGDEFVLVLGRLPDATHVEPLVQKLLRQLRGNFRLSSRTVYTTCSIGISLAPKDGADSSTLLKHADLAMYCAKAQGGDSFRLFEAAMRPGTDRLSIEVELREALERNELELYYQPRVDTITGRPTSLEALLRWNHPLRGLTLPGMFIPIAEETGLIDAIGQWVLERACQDARAWLDSGGEPLQFSVNLSPLQFAREELSERVAAALAAARLPPETLELEITETVAMRSPELAARHLARLRALGVSLAIDDFGTGHSSLARLKLLNVDCVKIDRSLVKDCAANMHDAALCRAAIALGLALGLEVVAEGVETQDQRQFLAQEHCSTIQGYLLARPMPAKEAFSLVRSLLSVPRLRGSLAK